jgi:hypothetical protein
MEFLYEISIFKLFQESNMPFIILNNTITDPSLDIIGMYQDRNGVIKRIRRDSAYGKKIMVLLNQEPEPLSQDATKLKEIMDRLVDRMDMGRVR